MKRIKVLVVEDSAVTRQVLRRIISGDPELEVIDTAIDPLIALKKIERNRPDVITLDLELPRMDGLTFLNLLMQKSPVPVVVISSMTERGSRKAIQALESGAVEVITKPELTSPESLQVVSVDIQIAIKAAYQSKLNLRPNVSGVSSWQDVDFPKNHAKRNSSRIIAIGASTGGTEALKQILSELPVETPGLVVVQHMPELFTRSFAERLNSVSRIIVKEASDNDEILDGCALIAPGNKHMSIMTRNGSYFVRLSETAKINRHRPSVDVLFHSVAREAGSRSKGILLTGMGEDGAAGLLAIKSAGGFTIAQDRASSVVYGMPRKAAEIGAAHEVLSLNRIIDYLKESTY